MGCKKGNIPWNKGIKYTQEMYDKIFTEEHNLNLSKKLTGREITWKDKISKTRLKKINDGAIKKIIGDKHYNWKGGKNRWQQNQNLKRLNNAGIFSCECCGGIEKLIVHHKDGDHTNNKFDNLMLLQHKCHSKKHFKLRKTCGKCGRLYSKNHKCPTKKERSKIASKNIIARERCGVCGKLFGKDKSKHSCNHPKGFLGRHHTKKSKQKIKNSLNKTLSRKYKV